MKQFTFAVLAPIVAILTAIGLQPLLVMIAPSIQAHSISMISLDSYFEILALLLMSFCAAYLIKRRTADRCVLAASLSGPLVSLIFIVAAISQSVGLSFFAGGMSALRAVLWMTAFAPLLSTTLAYSVVSSSGQQRKGCEVVWRLDG